MKKNKKFIGLLAALTMLQPARRTYLIPHLMAQSVQAICGNQKTLRYGCYGVYNTLRDFVHPDWWVFDNMWD
jgi:hypothetical protein